MYGASWVFPSTPRVRPRCPPPYGSGLRARARWYFAPHRSRPSPMRPCCWDFVGHCGGKLVASGAVGGNAIVANLCADNRQSGSQPPVRRKTHTLDAGVVAEEERRRCRFNPKLHANSGVWAVRPSFLTWPAVVARPAAALNVRSGPVNGLPLRFEAKRSSAPESEEAERGTSRPFVGDLSEGVQALIFRVCSAS
jgi:hypothetical protein